MASISLCMIVKNEEEVLRRCLLSVGDLVEEIIIVDTGSTDKTKEIAGEFTTKIYDYSWNQDFSSARNFAFSKATMEYQMWMDADDIMMEEDRKKFLSLKNQMDPQVDMVMMDYKMMSKDGKVVMDYHRERIVKAKDDFFFEGRVHEAISPRGMVIYWPVAICHKKEKESDSDRNLQIYEQMIQEGVYMAPRDQFYYARELCTHQQYEKALAIFTSFLSEKEGWVEDKINACQQLSICYRGLDMEQKELETLYLSFVYDTPRPEVCCEIGWWFMRKERYLEAVYWYQQALEQGRFPRGDGFHTIDCYEFLPVIQLCVCYDKLGDLKQAKQYHERAKSLQPDHPSVRYNERYFLQMEINRGDRQEK